MGKKRGMSVSAKSGIKRIISLYSPKEPVRVLEKIYLVLEKEGLVPDDRVVLSK